MTVQASILETIIALDALYLPDPDASIPAVGTTVDGRKVNLDVWNDGTGPVIEPWTGGGIYANPLLVRIEEGCL